MHLPKEIVLDLNRPQLKCNFFNVVYIVSWCFSCVYFFSLFVKWKKKCIEYLFIFWDLKVINWQASCFLKNLLWNRSENSIFSTSFKDVYITFSNYISAQKGTTVCVNTIKKYIFLNLTLRRNELCNPFYSLSKFRYLSQCLSLPCIFWSLCWFLL